MAGETTRWTLSDHIARRSRWTLSDHIARRQASPAGAGLTIGEAVSIAVDREMALATEDPGLERGEEGGQ